MILFAVFVAVCLFSAFMTLALGIYVYEKNPGSTTHRLFLLAMLTATYWAFGEYSLWQAGNYEEFLFWLKISSFWPLVAAFTVHFTLAFTESELLRKKWSRVLMVLIYFPAVLFAFIEIGTSLVFTVQLIPGTGFVYKPVEGSLVSFAETAYILIIMGAAVLVSVRAWRRAEQPKLRRQFRLVSAGLVIVIGFGFLSGVLLPLQKIYLPNMVFIGIVLFSLIITYTIQKYELFILSPGTAAPDIIRTLPDGLILGDVNGRIIMANARALNLFNVGDKDISGIMIEELLPRGVWSSIEPALIEEGHLSDVEAAIGGDKEKIVSIAGSMIREPGGDPAGYVLIFHDITRRKESEKALRLANEKISLMTRLTRHDITNLVTALWGYLEFLKEDGSGLDRESYLDKCLEITRNITRHLQFSREYQDIGVYKPGWQSLEVMFAKAITDLPGGSKIITRSIDPVEIYADPLAYKVFYNVLENSLQHGGYVTQIDISTRVSDLGELLIQIEDNGAGIPEMDKENIFVHGFGKHTGIGLSLSREILAITGITIRETGTWEKGARFEMTVPKGMWRLTARGA